MVGKVNGFENTYLFIIYYYFVTHNELQAE